MFIIIGIVIVLASVIGGYLLVNGPLAVLFQPSEFLVIGGAAIGSIVASTPLKTLALMGKKLPAALKGSPTACLHRPGAAPSRWARGP